MTAFIKHDGEYQINGYSFTSLGIKFPDGSVQSTAGGGGSGGVTSWASIIDKPTFATVATSGLYADLTGKPTTISSFTNDTGYITSVSLTWNNISGKPTIPSTTSELTNDAGYITSSSLTWSNISSKPTLFSGSYTDLIDKPTIPSLTGYATETYVNTQVANLVNAAPSTLDTLNELAAALGNDSNYATTISNQLGLKANSSSLSLVATSGSYTDLTNKPTIPTVPTTISSFTNNVGYITSSALTWSNISSKPNFATVATSGSYDDLTTKATLDGLTDVTINSPTAGQAVVYTGTTVQIGGIFNAGVAYSTATWNKNGGDVPIYGVTSSSLSSALVIGSSITVNYSGGSVTATITNVSSYLDNYTVVISVTNSTGAAQSITSIELPISNQTTYSWKNAGVETLSPFLLMGA